ncbi:MAG TPA: bifunctional precorrin-2 dehydrogenase/sirohydrochlorin ferrochelatase [Candidatus Binataceae bacterium]|nr:bifunctional precorrin-2 dehydrogenase/sirohydrochlorin ferrochelatase [Candidatus Binataceae bacterium]
MAHVPIFLDVTGRRCVVVGGGEVAARKVRSLVEAGAEVRVISPSIVEELRELAETRKIQHFERKYESGDMAEAVLVYAASDDIELHKMLHKEARQRGIPINIADAPELCSFISPSVVIRGSLQIAISTEGASPAMARRIRERLERLFGPEYGVTLEILRAARNHLKANEPDIRIRARKLTALAAIGIPEYLRRGDLDAIEAILRREIGIGLEAMGLSSIEARPPAR